MKTLGYYIACCLIPIVISCTYSKTRTPEIQKLIQLTAFKKANIVDTTSITFFGSFNENNPKGVLYPKLKGIPDSLTNIRKYYYCFDDVQAFFQAYKGGLINKNDCIRYLRKQVIDTIECTSNYIKTFLIIVSGVSKRGNKYYLIDSNNNYDLSDESVLKAAELISNSQPHKVIFEKYFNGKIQSDSTWIFFNGIENRDILRIKFCERTIAFFSYDSVKYSITAYPSDWTGVKYTDDVVFELTDNVQNKKQVFVFNQYAHLGNHFYQVTCSPDGRQIYLKLNPDAWENGSTQLNMPAISFKTVTLKGDTITFPKDYKRKYVLLDFWATTCAPCVDDIKNCYKNLYKKYGNNRFEIIGIADDPKTNAERFVSTNMISWTIVPDQNRIIQDLYRIKVLPTLFLIDPDGVIIAKGTELRKGKINTVLEKLLDTK